MLPMGFTGFPTSQRESVYMGSELQGKIVVKGLATQDVISIKQR